jgi:ribosomal protein S12 methylthiotransferase accessory factor
MFVRCSITLCSGDLEEPPERSLRLCIERLKAAGMRVAVKDVTSPDVAASPFRVVRALGVNMQPIDFGFTVRRLGNPRLRALLTGNANPYPHPVA